MSIFSPRFSRVSWFVAVVGVLGGAAHGRVAAAVEFNRDIRPILSNHCFACHGPDEEKRKAGLRLDLESAAKMEQDGAAAIVPGDPEASLIVQRAIHSDPDEVMPPPEYKKPLSGEQIALLKQWIKEGATWQDHWAFVPIQSRAVPKTRDAGWARNAVDHFIQARLDQEDLEPSAEASREVLIRRVTFDLTGLPPTEAEMDAFLSDSNPQAYERLVDRLLRSPSYGEHMARYWLDAARYGDTHGLHLDNYREMWPYRDWVVGAFNRNLSYRDFVIEQIAGDLLPNATRDQLVATGFNRCHVTTGEGGSIKDEVFVRNVIDRVVTTSTVFMGLTFECTRCHNHKFDPFTMEDFYSMFAYFNSLDGDPLDGNRKDHAPVLRLPSDYQTESLQRYDAAIQPLQKRLAGAWPTVDEAQSQWEADIRAAAAEKAAADALPTVQLGEWQTVGPFYDVRLYLFSRKYGPEGKTVDLAAEYKNNADDTLKWRARSDWKDGEVQSDLPGEMAANYLYRTIESPEEQTVPVSLGSDDAIKVYLNGKEILANDVDRGAAADQESLELALQKGRNELLIKIVNYNAGSGFYFSLKEAKSEIPGEIQKILEVVLAERNDEQQKKLRDYYRNQVSRDSELTAAITELKRLREARAAVDRDIPLTLVWKELKEPRPAHLLKRGNYDDKGEEVSRQTPAVLPPLPEGVPNDRLGFAYWLTDPSHPLTARVAVNRFWQQVFGLGLVKTAEDFGVQGERPSHPELLDWLAYSFRDSGWDMKELMRTLVLSATYRQSSYLTPSLRERDPENRLLARGPRFRLDAEMLRDQALFVSGLLVDQMGGESVKPPQPDGLWFAVGYSGSNTVRFKADSGSEKVHRRTLYTFVKRTSPPPQMSTFDGPSREACVMRRERTNTPMQALLLLNDPQYVEAARGLASRALTEFEGADDERAMRLFRVCTGRVATPAERDDLVALYQESLRDFEADPEAAVALTAIGEQEPAGDLSRPQLAAWTTVASMVMNLDEVVSKN